MKVGDRVQGHKGIGTIIFIPPPDVFDEGGNNICVWHDTWRNGHSCGSYGYFDVPERSCWIYLKEDLEVATKMSEALAELNR